MDYPILIPERILAPSHIKVLDVLGMIFFPAGLPIYWIASKRYKNLKRNIEAVLNANVELAILLQRSARDNE
jgi:hypothetical protein